MKVLRLLRPLLFWVAWKWNWVVSSRRIGVIFDWNVVGCPPHKWCFLVQIWWFECGISWRLPV